MAALFDEKEDWTFGKLDAVYEEIEKIATEELKLSVFPNQIEVIDSEKMLDAYSSMAMPVYYRHWSLGKSFISNQKSYQAGHQSLAYEVVINSNPCISYLQESNDMTMQTLVLAHAAFGHNFVFKNNQEFIKWTSPESILDELNFAKVFIARCEEKFGVHAVEAVLDACHALMDHGVDTHKRQTKSLRESSEDFRLAQSADQRMRDYDLLWEKTVYSRQRQEEVPAEWVDERWAGEQNLLYFIEKRAPGMPQWKREIVRIVRRIAQYFHPQGLTKVLNEGWATFTHHYVLNRMHEKGLITDGAWFTFIQSHTNVIAQPEFDKPYYSGINPYALGFSMFRDIKRMCESPTEEDRSHFPHLAGSNWLDACHEAVREYNDSGFISQYLSPKLIRDFRLFALEDDAESPTYRVEKIHDERGYGKIRALLAEKHTRSARVPAISVEGADLRGDRVLRLSYRPYRGRPLDEDSAKMTLGYIESLWGYPVKLEAK